MSFRTLDIWSDEELEGAFEGALRAYERLEYPKARQLAMSVIEYHQTGARAWYLMACAAHEDEELALAEYAIAGALQLDPARKAVPGVLREYVEQLLRLFPLESAPTQLGGSGGEGAPAIAGLTRLLGRSPEN